MNVGLISAAGTIALSTSLMCSLASAQEATEKEMRFAVVRSADPGCEPVCPEWISAEGEITGRSDDRLKELLRKLGKRRLPVIIDSPGGNVESAIAMGRLIRQKKLDVAVGRTSFIACTPEQKDCKVNEGRGAAFFGSASGAGASCNSACPLVLAGGVHRIAETYASIGLHQVTTIFTKSKVTYQTRYRLVNGKKKVISKKVVKRQNTGSFTKYEMSKSQEKMLRSYLAEMGVDANLVDRMKQTKASDIAWLSSADSVGHKLTERHTGVAALIGTQVCTTRPASSNCRLITTDDV